MSKTFKAVALCVVLGMVSVGCQKEDAVGVPSQVSDDENVRVICYTIDETAFQIELRGEGEWQVFFDNMCALAKNGHQVFFWNGNGSEQSFFSKETLTFTTADEKEANTWCDKKIAQGYKVGMTYDFKEGVFVCVAIR